MKTVHLEPTLGVELGYAYDKNVFSLELNQHVKFQFIWINKTS